MSAGARRLGIALGLALGPACALGFARFAYALELPPMRAALDWSFATAGAMNAANALGYLVGALVCAPLAARLGARRVFLGGLIVTGVALLASAATGNVVLLLVLRLIAGISGAGGFVLGGALTARLGRGERPGRAARLLGVYFAGGGLGIFVSALVVPPILGAAGDVAGWRWGWVALAGLTFLALAAVVPAARACPEAASEPGGGSWPVSRLVALLLAYTLYGTGYIAYMTFIVAFLRAEGAATGEVVAFWGVLGLAAIAGGFLWGPLLGRARGGRGPAIVLTLVTAGALLPLVSGSWPFTFGSAVVFGGSFLAVVTSVTTVVRASLPPHQWTSAIAGQTVAFAAGQCLGPLLAGVLSDQADGVRAGLLLSGILLAVSVLVALCQRTRVPDGVDTGPCGRDSARMCR